MPFIGALLSAAILWAAFPPLDLGFLVFVAPVPFLWGLRRASSFRMAGWLGFTFGVSYFSLLMWWLWTFGLAAFVALMISIGIYASLFGLLVHLASSWAPWRWWLYVTGMWALFEFNFARWPIGGLEWGSLGIPIGAVPGARGAAQWIGPTGWSVLIMAFAAGVVLMFEEERDRRWMEISAAIIGVLIVAGAVFTPDANGPEVRVALIQGNSPCPRVHCTGEKEQIYTSHLTLTRRLESGTVDLVLWGEDSFGGAINPTFNAEVREQMSAEAIRLDSYLLAGGTRPSSPGMFENYVVLFDPSGVIVGEYLKQHPVPFGEYVPFRAALDWLPVLDQVPSDMVRGTGPEAFDFVVGGVQRTLGTTISYESSFFRILRATINDGARLLVVATNEGSYGLTPASDQLIGIVRMGAVSLGVDVVQVAVTGKSTVIGADGSVGIKSGLFTEEVLVGTVNVQDSPRTLYAVVGDWLQLLAIAIGLVLLAGYRSSRRPFKIRPGQHT